MTRMIFIRHGNSEGNRDRRFCGHTDVKLTELGLTQARLAAEFLKNERIDEAYASDLVRAYETGRIVCEGHGVVPIPDEKLREVYGGSWERLIYEEIAERYPEDNAMWNKDIFNCRPTDGESIAELAERVCREVWRLAEACDGKSILVATHATPIRMLMREWVTLGAIPEPKWVGNAAVTIARYDARARKVEIELLCENGFLGELVSE